MNKIFANTRRFSLIFVSMFALLLFPNFVAATTDHCEDYEGPALESCRNYDEKAIKCCEVYEIAEQKGTYEDDPSEEMIECQKYFHKYYGNFCRNDEIEINFMFKESDGTWKGYGSFNRMRRYKLNYYKKNYKALMKDIYGGYRDFEGLYLDKNLQIPFSSLELKVPHSSYTNNVAKVDVYVKEKEKRKEPDDPKFDASNPCSNKNFISGLKFVGKIISIIQIAVPIILIIMVLVDITKSIITFDDNKSGKNLSIIIKRLIAAVSIFFIIAIIKLICNLVGVDNGISNCFNSISSPWK